MHIHITSDYVTGLSGCTEERRWSVIYQQSEPVGTVAQREHGSNRYKGTDSGVTIFSVRKNFDGKMFDTTLLLIVKTSKIL